MPQRSGRSRSRIYEILPQRIQQWQQSPCVAEEHGKRLLERIRREQQQARLRLQDMERRFHELEALIARAKGYPARPQLEVARNSGKKWEFWGKMGKNGKKWENWEKMGKLG